MSPNIHLVTYNPNLETPTYLNQQILTLTPDQTNLTTQNPSHQKLKSLRNHLAHLPPHDILCYIDPNNTLAFLPDNLDTFTNKFSLLNTDILFAATTTCVPWSHVASLYPVHTSIYRFLFAGGFIGYVWALQELFNLDHSQSPTEQAYFTYCYINYIHEKDKDKSKPIHHVRIQLDHHCEIFQNADGIPWSHFYIQNNELHNRVERTNPNFIFFPDDCHLTQQNTSILPIVSQEHTFPPADTMKKPAIVDENGIPVEVPINHSQIIQPTPTPPLPKLITHPLDTCPQDQEIIALAKANAKKYFLPDQTKILTRDQVNSHAIIQHNRFVNPVTDKTMHREFALTNRRIIENWFGRVGSSNNLLLDICLNDCMGIHLNTTRWSHSVLGFSKDKYDEKNVLLPDLYAMQDYKGSLDENLKDNLPTLKKTNKLLFIGSAYGKINIAENDRLKVCRFAQNHPWIDAWISNPAHFEPDQALHFKDLMHPHMSIPEQQTYRHILVIDGNTACWDRLAWVMNSLCVCWKQESDDQCWYYPFLKPWVHYIPFTLDTLEETWNKVKDDRALQLEIVANANQFVEDYLSQHAHALYTRTLLDEIGVNNQLGKTA